MDEVVCLTVEQPYASAIADGPIRLHTRLYTPANDAVVGSWVVLHAATADVVDEDLQIVTSQWQNAPQKCSDYPKGVLLGAAHVCRLERCKPRDQNGCGARSPGGHWCMVLIDRVIRLKQPIAVSPFDSALIEGGSDVAPWVLPANVKQQVEAQLPEPINWTRDLAPPRSPLFPSRKECNLEHSAIYSALSVAGYRMAQGKVEGMVAVPVSSQHNRAQPQAVGIFKVDRSPPADTNMMRVVAHPPTELDESFARCSLGDTTRLFDPRSPNTVQLEDAAEALAKLGKPPTFGSPFASRSPFTSGSPFASVSPQIRQPQKKVKRFRQQQSWEKGSPKMQVWV